jgi:hypothetical protein
MFGRQCWSEAGGAKEAHTPMNFQDRGFIDGQLKKKDGYIGHGHKGLGIVDGRFQSMSIRAW